jgi:hypothetical protein
MIMAVDSTVPDVPALRSIPADRLLPDDELWGWRSAPGAAQWHFWRSPVTITSVVDLSGAGWNYVRIKGREFISGKEVIREVSNPGEVLITFRTNTYAVKGKRSAND